MSQEYDDDNGVTPGADNAEESRRQGPTDIGTHRQQMSVRQKDVDEQDSEDQPEAEDDAEVDGVHGQGYAADADNQEVHKVSEYMKGRDVGARAKSKAWVREKYLRE